MINQGVRNVLFIITFILVSCECEEDRRQGEVIYSSRKIEYIGNTKQVTKLVVTEYKAEDHKKIVTLEYNGE